MFAANSSIQHSKEKSGHILGGEGGGAPDI